MDVIRQPLPEANLAAGEQVDIAVDRHQLQKRRWRGIAADGREFGFDLDEPLRDGAAILAENARIYVIRQQPEPLFEITLPNESRLAAEIAWHIGNMHLPAEIQSSSICVAAEPGARSLLERLGLNFRETIDLFRPSRSAATHHRH